MKEVIVVRHGETDWNAEGRIQGHQESSLNERGRAQAAALEKRFESERIDELYSSDLQRTLDTARPISEATGVEIRTDERLREWKLGRLETLSINEAREREPEALRIYEEGDPDVVIPEGESIRQRFERCTSCLKEIVERHGNARVVVVTHGGILDDFYRHVSGIALDADRDWPLYNAGVNTLRIEDGRLRIKSWGDTGHLGGIGAMADWKGE